MVKVSAAAAASQKPAEKRLWGTPLKLKQANEKIAELEARIDELLIKNGKAAIENTLRQNFPQTEPYDLEVWSCTKDTKTERGVGDPYRWRHWHADDKEWIYHERLNFWNDSGYGTYLLDRMFAMVSNAVGGFTRADGTGRVDRDLQIQRFGKLDQRGDQTWDRLPGFDPMNCIEVIVKLVKAEPKPESE